MEVLDNKPVSQEIRHHGCVHPCKAHTCHDSPIHGFGSLPVLLGGSLSTKFKSWDRQCNWPYFSFNFVWLEDCFSTTGLTKGGKCILSRFPFLAFSCSSPKAVLWPNCNDVINNVDVSFSSYLRNNLNKVLRVFLGFDQIVEFNMLNC